MRTLCAISLLMAALHGTSIGQGLPVVVVLKKGGAQEVVLVGRTDNGVRLQPKGAGGGDYVATFDQIDEVRFVLPSGLNRAQDAWNQSQWDLVATILRPVVAPLVPYLDLPNNNAVTLATYLADALRRAGKFDEALAYYDRMRLLATASAAAQAGIWTAHCHVMANRTDQAWKTVQSVNVPKDNDELQALAQYVRAQVRFAQKDYLATIDEVARGISFSRMESESYPEMLFLAAQCYEMLGGTNVTVAAAQKSGLSQFTLGNTNLALITRLTTNAPPVASATPPVPPTFQGVLGNTNYPTVALEMYREIATNFPTTVWAQRSQARISSLAPAPATESTE